MLPSATSASRRHLLRGLGVSMALPWMPSLISRSAMATPTLNTALAPPVRMAFVFVPNGVHMADWRPTTEGYGFTLPYILEPLQAVREELLVLSGLTHDKGRANGDGPGDHARSASVFLTGAQPRKTDGSNIRSGISVDQVAAQAAKQSTRFASLELGCEPGRSAGNCDSGYSCAYSSSISWGGDASPMGKETNPRFVFERLFGTDDAGERDRNAARREALKKSILDFVADDAQRLQRQLGREDQRKLDEYLTGVREIERRIERTAAQPTQTSETGYPRPKGIPGEYGEHIRLMCDMVVLAFQTDSTRVSSIMFADAGSNRSYRQIGVNEGHHDLSHHQGDAAKHAKIREINRFHITQLAYLLEKMKATPDGEGCLLDNVMVMYGSGLSDGNRHNHEDLPVLLAGRGGNTIDTGRHLYVSEETPMCNLFMSMLDRFGASVDYIGDSTGRLPGLQV
ncbi:MAG: DUF1552 domain-containing protein [Planctomycetaceae bacterium]|nr:DUF1552 domain-containing protein [Planctomycetaceae bacterium]